MPFDATKIRHCIKEFDFDTLFREELGWNRLRSRRLDIDVDGHVYSLSPVAEKCGMAIYLYKQQSENFPDYPTMRKIEGKVEKTVHEHIIIYTDNKKELQVWQWVKREPGKPTACRIHKYYKNQSGESLVQKLQYLNISFEEEEQGITITEVAGRARQAFDIEKVTKKFYDRYKKEHIAFSKFIKGIEQQENHDWYASVMLDRLMFIYFLQKKDFLDGDPDYLANKLTQSKGKDKFYLKFLRPLFFDGFAKEEKDRTPETNKLLGRIPYLNGGIFLPHRLEKEYKNIDIPDVAFEKLFAFFNQYQWHLDDRPLRSDREINPDVLGYIFEKYVNQKQMGAYYTKEDITEYISKNTIIPFLFDRAEKECKVAFEKSGYLWSLARENPDRYIYNAIKHGIKVDIRQHPVKDLEKPLSLPKEIGVGIDEVPKRTDWNRPAPEEFALPTEIWREVVARRQRYDEVRSKLESGEVSSINDFITYNLDIRQFALDAIENCEGPELLRAYYHAIENVTILDPTCGSGAFLFAALNILEPLYEACLDRMQGFLDDMVRSGEKHRPEKFKDFREVLDRMEQHPNRRYFIYKTIILNNLFGVDIMEEATEIAKLRLFLKLAALVDKDDNKPNMGIEPLPDIDFNIQAGNTLIGYLSIEEVKKGPAANLFLDEEMAKALNKIEDKADELDRLVGLFRNMQAKFKFDSDEFASAKASLRKRLSNLEEELNRYLAGEYEIDTKKKGDFKKWLKSYQPLHWFIDFHNIIKKGGFDVIIGNPPYIEYKEIKNIYTLNHYSTLECGNLYAYAIERCFSLLNKEARFSFIVQLPIVCTDRMRLLREECIKNTDVIWFANFDDRPARLFDGLEHIRATIFCCRKNDNKLQSLYSTNYNRWYSENRDQLFELIQFENMLAHMTKGTIPKVGDGIGRNLLEYLKKQTPIAASKNKYGSNIVYYHNSPQYWIRAMDFAPYFWNERDGKKLSSQVKQLRIYEDIDSMVLSAVMNSTIFYWWFVIQSDCRHLNMREVDNFRINIERMPGSMKRNLSQLTSDLMKDLKRNSVRKKAYYQTTGKVIYDEFFPGLSKPIIDKLDKLIGSFYGFSDIEVDYIINYDIKYRMGIESIDEDEGSVT